MPPQGCKRTDLLGTLAATICLYRYTITDFYICQVLFLHIAQIFVNVRLILSDNLYNYNNSAQYNYIITDEPVTSNSMKICRKDVIIMNKRMINETTDTVFNEDIGQYVVKRFHQVANLSTEDKYYKFYHEGLMYIADMPPECHRVFYALLDNMTYVDQTVEGLGDYGMHIFLNADIKRGIAKELGLANYRTIDNIITKLVKD